MIHQTSDPLIAELVQMALHEEGLYEGQIDGDFGPRTEAAFAIYGNYSRYAAVASWATRLTADQQADMAKFLKCWKANEGLYRSVAVVTNVPAELVAAIHWRESSGNFGTYLHNGDPLGAPTVHVPRGLNFPNWSTAAADALSATREPDAHQASGIEEWTTHLDCLCVFAEYFNGEGYRARGVPDPYVLAGTTGYQAGKFVEDEVYDPSAVDGQLGVLAMVRTILPATA